jgi:hypothetical protein
MQSCEFKLKENSTIKKSHMNVSVAMQDQLKTIEVSVLISCIASIYHVYVKFTLKIKDSTCFSPSFGKI